LIIGRTIASITALPARRAANDETDSSSADERAPMNGSASSRSFAPGDSSGDAKNAGGVVGAR